WRTAARAREGAAGTTARRRKHRNRTRRMAHAPARTGRAAARTAGGPRTDRAARTAPGTRTHRAARTAAGTRAPRAARTAARPAAHRAARTAAGTRAHRAARTAAGPDTGRVGAGTGPAPEAQRAGGSDRAAGRSSPDPGLADTCV